MVWSIITEQHKNHRIIPFCRLSIVLTNSRSQRWFQPTQYFIRILFTIRNKYQHTDFHGAEAPSRLLLAFIVAVLLSTPFGRFFNRWAAMKPIGSGGRSLTSNCMACRRIGATVWSMYCLAVSACNSARVFLCRGSFTAIDLSLIIASESRNTKRVYFDMLGHI